MPRKTSRVPRPGEPTPLHVCVCLVYRRPKIVLSFLPTFVRKQRNISPSFADNWPRRRTLLKTERERPERRWFLHNTTKSILFVKTESVENFNLNLLVDAAGVSFVLKYEDATQNCFSISRGVVQILTKRVQKSICDGRPSGNRPGHAPFNHEYNHD